MSSGLGATRMRLTATVTATQRATWPQSSVAFPAGRKDPRRPTAFGPGPNKRTALEGITDLSEASGRGPPSTSVLGRNWTPGARQRMSHLMRSGVWRRLAVGLFRR